MGMGSETLMLAVNRDSPVTAMAGVGSSHQNEAIDA